MNPKATSSTADAAPRLFVQTRSGELRQLVSGVAVPPTDDPGAAQAVLGQVACSKCNDRSPTLRRAMLLAIGDEPTFRSVVKTASTCQDWTSILELVALADKVPGRTGATSYQAQKRLWESYAQFKLGDYVAASRAKERQLELQQKLSRKDRTAATGRQLAEYRAKAQDWKGASQALVSAISIASGTKVEKLVPSWRLELGRLYQKSRNRTGACQTWKALAIDTSKTVSEKLRRSASELMSKYACP